MRQLNIQSLLLVVLVSAISFSCSSNKGTLKSEEIALAGRNANEQPDSASISSSIEKSRAEISRPSSLTMLDGVDSILTDGEAVSKLMESARKHYAAAIKLQKEGQQDSSAIEFENAIDVMNDLSYYPDIEENKDFVALSQSIISDYEKYISSVQNLGPGTSVFALEEKLSQIVDTINVSGTNFPTAQIPKTTVPLVMNRYVEQNIEFFTTKGRWHMQDWIRRSGLYIPLMKKVFRDAGLPEEIAYLSLPESGLHPTARSWARAVGLWQFIRSTGNLYGLHSNWWYDERRDPVKATEAAASHLKDLYEYYNDWYLAIAAYNCGTRHIDRAIRRSHHIRDFWKIRRLLPRETRNYVPQYIAVTLIVTNPKEYGFNDDTETSTVTCDTVKIPDSVDLKVLADATGVDLDTLRDLNPQLVHAVTPPSFDGQEYPLLVPAGTGPAFEADYQKLPETVKLTWTFHRVIRGETIYGIARRYRVSMASLKFANDLSRRTRRVRPGTLLIIPVKSSYYALSGKSKTSAIDIGSNIAETRYDSSPIHVVRRGETLSEIAEEHGTTVRTLKRLNNLSTSRIKPRMRLFVTSADTDNHASAPRSAVKVAAKTPSPAPSTTGSYVYHKVKRHETLGRIATIYGVNVSDLKNWNNLHSTRVRRGQLLMIMSPSIGNQKGDNMISETSDSRMIYRVRRGDSLWSIAHKFGVTIDRLRKWNTTAEDLRPGQRIIIYN
ncbi:MAG TPA: LysM peptidoglycan-binding domain-containing protein [Candidatus Kryptonia bacterium]